MSFMNEESFEKYKQILCLTTGKNCRYVYLYAHCQDEKKMEFTVLMCDEQKTNLSSVFLRYAE